MDLENKGLMDHGHDTFSSRDYDLDFVTCRKKDCAANVGGKCVSPASIIIKEDGKCGGAKLRVKDKNNGRQTNDGK